MIRRTRIYANRTILGKPQVTCQKDVLDRHAAGKEAGSIVGQSVFQPAHHMRQAIGGARQVGVLIHGHAGPFHLGDGRDCRAERLDRREYEFVPPFVGRPPGPFGKRRLCIRPILVGVQQILGDQAAFPQPHIAVPVGWNLQRR